MLNKNTWAIVVTILLVGIGLGALVFVRTSEPRTTQTEDGENHSGDGRRLNGVIRPPVEVASAKQSKANTPSSARQWEEECTGHKGVDDTATAYKSAIRFLDSGERENQFLCDAMILAIQSKPIDELQKLGIKSDPFRGVAAYLAVEIALEKARKSGTVSDEKARAVQKSDQTEIGSILPRLLKTYGWLKQGYPTTTSSQPQISIKNDSPFGLEGIRISLDMYDSQGKLIWQGSDFVDHLNARDEKNGQVGTFLEFIPEGPIQIKVHEVQVDGLS